ncbi:hypothetical protein DEF23_24750 [Marinitenerispora sediminis]|uniref:Peptidase M4 domain-containing protein n=1 Tax=Marinitenerispora sediminis TaxID=1931232 RepID=A0A368T5X3_9ACTN|nr:hypothetical protein DEF23_24750 [Marinitenerispora sediminis]RCV51704.1 hypothetical protein DEF28_14735 [Marinitenerispora sediminis]RCV59097.1 hypothetical protein DEF24_11120 [Marinitenerispora sediminis]
MTTKSAGPDLAGTAVPESVAARRLPYTVPRQRRATVPGRAAAPTPAAPLVGPRILVYKQDPMVTELGIRPVFLPSVVLNGPADARVTTQLPGTTPVARDVNGDFIFPANSREFDCSHTFAVVRETLTMYERHHGAPLPFAWNAAGNTQPIAVFPRAAMGANAFYSRTAKALKFLFFTPQGSPSEVFTCRSLDIVAHETGHAVLDGLKPGWLAAGNPPQTGGLHEAWGDLSAIFLALSQPDQAEALVTLTKGNLHATSFLSAVAEQFGTALGLSFGLRNADNDLKLSEAGNEVHAISQVFTGGIYDVLADVYVFEYERQRAAKSPTLVLMEVAGRICKLLFDAVVLAPPTAATYADVVNAMLRVSAAQGDPPIYRTFVRNRFALREVVASPTPITDLVSGQMPMTDAEYTGAGGAEDATEVAVADERSASLCAAQDRSTSCGTMQLPEFQVVSVERLADRGPLEDADILAGELRELGRAFGR